MECTAALANYYESQLHDARVMIKKLEQQKRSDELALQQTREQLQTAQAALALTQQQLADSQAQVAQMEYQRRVRKDDKDRREQTQHEREAAYAACMQQLQGMLKAASKSNEQQKDSRQDCKDAVEDAYELFATDIGRHASLGLLPSVIRSNL